jgi:hypothetical protein
MRHRRAQLPIIPSDVLAELQQVTGDPTLQHRDMMEWKKKRPQEVRGEVIFFLPALGLYVAVKRVTHG